MDFGKALLGEQIPLAEAAEFFIDFKKTAGWQDMPDETGALEGKFAIPVEQALALMKQQAECVLRCMVASHIYGASARGPGAKELSDELRRLAYLCVDHAEYLMGRMATLGGPVHIDEVEPPPASSNVADITARMIRAQQECLAGWNALCEATCGNPMEDRCKKNAACVQAELDGFWKLVPHTVSSQVLGPPAEGEEPPVGMRGELPPGMEHDEAAESPEDEANEPPEVQAAEDAAGIEMHPPAEKKPAAKKEAAHDPKQSVERELQVLKGMGVDNRDSARFNAYANDAVFPAWLNSHAAADYVGQNTARKSPAIGSVAGAGLGALGGLALSRSGASAALGAGAGGLLGGLLGATHKHFAQRSARQQTLKNQLRAHGVADLVTPGGMLTIKDLPQEYKEASLKKIAASMRFKLALRKTANDPVESAQMAPPGDGGTVATNYLAAEQMAQQAQEQNESGYYRAKLQEALQAQDQMQQQIQSAQQQLQSLQMQASEAGSQIQAATEQATQAQEEALQQTLLAAKMRMGMQELRAQMLQIASQEPAAVAEEKQRQEAQSQAQALQQGLVDPAQAGPEAASAEAAPNAAAPDASGMAPATAPAESTAPMAQTAEPQAGMKVANLVELAKSRLPGALIGGGLGALATGAATRKGTGKLQERVQQLESMPDGGYGQALELARAKADLAQAEANQKHPGKAMALGALAGAGAGAALQPRIGNIIRSAKDVGPKVKELLGKAG